MVEVSISASFFLDPRIAKAELATKSAEVNEDAVIDLVQAECNHEGYIAEAPYKESSWCSDSSPPFRVCLRCGVIENGWAGYSKLKGDDVAMKVTRDEGYRIRRSGAIKQ